jgi:hypothetical protein
VLHRPILVTHTHTRARTHSLTPSHTATAGTVRTDCNAANKNSLMMGGPAMIKLYYVVAAPSPPPPFGHNFTYVLEQLDEINALVAKQHNMSKKSFDEVSGSPCFVSRPVDSLFAFLLFALDAESAQQGSTKCVLFVEETCPTLQVCAHVT